MTLSLRKSTSLIGAGLLALAVCGGWAQASTAHAKKSNLKYKPVVLPAPDLSEFTTEEKLVDENKTIDEEDEVVVRAPAGHAAKVTGSEDLMTPELKAFRDKLLKARHAEQLEPLLREYDSKYDTYPNDLKYVIARLSPIIPFRGFFWRMATLAHQAVVTQEILLGMVRSFAEQVMIFEPDAQWQAYLTYLSIPTAALLVPPGDKHDGVARADQRFYVENDLADFLATDVYAALGTAIRRVARLQTTVTIGGRQTPIVFDNRIRFGDQAFNQAYDAVDRFKLIGDAERYAAMARYHRRMATICQMAAYNLNGNIALRREIGTMFGIDAKIGSSAGDALSVDGLTRRERIRIASGQHGLFALRNKDWMKTAYQHLSKWAEYNAKAWSRIQHDRENYEMLLDPDLFNGRSDQIDKAVANIRRMLPGLHSTATALQPIHGAISGDEIKVDFKSFFENPPTDLKALMPVKFNNHEDARGLASVYGADNLSFDDTKSVIRMKIDVGGGRKKEIEWRNYCYGRATGWDPEAYGRLFPGVTTPEEVARAQRILAETRGGRPLLNTLAVFIK